MRYLNRLAWAVAVVVATAATGSAQQGTVTTQGGQVVGSTLTGTGGLTGGQPGMLGGGGGAGGQGSLSSSQLEATQLQTLESPPQIGMVTSTGSGLTSILSNWYADPRYQGSTWDLSKSATPGGFGKATGGTGTGLGGTNALGGAGAGGRGGLTGAGGRLGALGTQRQGFGSQNTANQTGTVIPMQVQVAYPAIPAPGFAAPPVPATQIQADLSGMLARSTTLMPSAANVQVTANGSTVTLRGTVGDIEEARLIEGAARLTPGVRSVKNELTFPVSR